MNILILDDEPKIRHGMVKLIEEACHHRHTVTSFGDPLKALCFLESHPVDLVITDIRMPELSGLDLIQRLQEQGAGCEVLILSGYSEFAYAQKAIDLKVRKYLTKPTDPEALLTVIDEVEQLRTGTPSDRQAVYDGDNPVIFRCLDYVDRNYPTKFTLADLAGELYISPTYLCRLFKKETDLNLTEYITSVRVEKAKKLLLSPDLTITQISDLVGYKDAGYFSAVFKRLTGQTPHEFRSHVPPQP